ncbi:MAG: hypothetical protein AABY76_03705, partial [Planctomycetota bacterium]
LAFTTGNRAQPRKSTPHGWRYLPFPTQIHIKFVQNNPGLVLVCNLNLQFYSSNIWNVRKILLFTINISSPFPHLN